MYLWEMNIMTNNKITCSLCKKEKEANEFYLNRNKTNGRDSNCKLCVLTRKGKKYKKEVQHRKARQSIAKKKDSPLILVEQLKTEQLFVPRETEVQLSFFDILEEVINESQIINKEDN